MPLYKNIFEYEYIEDHDCYKNCRFIRDFGTDFKIGMKVHTVWVDSTIKITALQSCDDEDADIEFESTERN